MTRVTGVVLAGGDSTRFGDAEKALATLEGDPLVARAAAAVREATDATPVVAARRDAQAARLSTVLDDATFAYDDPDYAGPLAGLVGAAPAAETPWLFVCGCDMPLLSARAVEWLADRLPDEAAALAPVQPDGTPEPLHAVYRREAVAAAADGLPRAAGVHALLDALSVETVPIGAAPPDVPLADSVTNVNTPEELAAVRDHSSA